MSIQIFDYAPPTDKILIGLGLHKNRCGKIRQFFADNINSPTFVDINTLFKNSCYKYYSIPEVLIHLNNIIYKKTGTHPYPTYDINTLAQYTGGNACFELINDDMTYYTRFYINGYLINFDLPQYSNAICKKIPLEALNSYLAYVREQYLKNSKKIKSKRTIKSAPHEIN